MKRMGNTESLNPFSLGTSSTEDDEPREVTVGDLTAKFYFDQDAEDLVPARFLQEAERSPTVRHRPWIFREAPGLARHADLKKWPSTDNHFRGVFETLHQVPDLKVGISEGGMEDCVGELIEGNSREQARVVHTLLSDIREMMDVEVEVDDGRVFSLRPRLGVTRLEYWTGYRQKHKDGPDIDGVLALQYSRSLWAPVQIVPISVTKYEDPFETALSDRFKIILGQLLTQVRPLRVPGDKIPDQEVFLIGQHGSRLHIMRVFFPGHKLSSIWCRRELSCKTGPLPSMSATTPTLSSPAREGPTNPQPHPRHRREKVRSHSAPPRFYTQENLARFRQHVQATKLNMLDNELDIHKFRVLCTQEYDLWDKHDFTAAIQILVALHMYLLSGTESCGPIQAAFKKRQESADKAALQTAKDDSQDEEDDEDSDSGDDDGYDEDKNDDDDDDTPLNEDMQKMRAMRSDMDVGSGRLETIAEEDEEEGEWSPDHE